MPQFVAPGVYVLERDFSDYVAALQQTSIGMVGTAKRGPLDTPTLCTTPEQFLAIFGEPSVNQYGPYAALNYLRQGNQLWYVRVARQFTNDSSTLDAAVVAGATTISLGTGEGAAYTVGDYIRIRQTGKPTTVAEIASIDGDDLTLETGVLSAYTESASADTSIDSSTSDIGANEAEVFGYNRVGGTHTPLVHFKAKNPGDWANFGTRRGIEVVIEDGGQFANVDPITGLTVEDSEGNPLKGIVPSVPSLDTTVDLFALTSADEISVNELRGANTTEIVRRVVDATGDGTTVSVEVNTSAGIEVGDFVTLADLATATDYNGTFEVTAVPDDTHFEFDDPGAGQTETPSADAVLAVNTSSNMKGLVYRCTAVRSTGSDWEPAGVLTKQVKVFYQGRQVEFFDNIIGYDPTSELFWDSVIGTPAAPRSEYITAEYLGKEGEQPINTYHRTRHPNNPRLLMGNSTVVKVDDDANAASNTYKNARGVNGDNPGSADYIGTIDSSGAHTGMQNFLQTELYDLNMIAAPGNTAAAVIEEILAICKFRNDCLGIVDPPFGLTPQEVVDWHNGTGVWTGQHTAFTGNQAAMYYPWIKQFDPYSRKEIWLPPSAFIPAVIAYNDAVGEVWYAPAGITRGKVDRALVPETVVSQGDVEFFYGPGNGNAVNPVQVFTRDGIVVYGQRTLQRHPSALDRINVRRLLFFIEKSIATSIRVLVFEQNDEILWGQFRAIVEPFLEQLKGQRALEWYRVVCDGTTNTPDRRNNNELYAKIYLIPVKAAEKIIVDFTLLPSGANVEEFIALDNGQNINP